MDTKDKYLDADTFVARAGEKGPEWYVEAMADRGIVVEGAMAHHPLNDEVPVDGWVVFYGPGKVDAGEPFEYYRFPFRSAEKDDDPWAAFPDKPNFKQQPVWEWTNPAADPHENLTLEPSIGVGDPMHFHCYVRGGEVDWL